MKILNFFSHHVFVKQEISTVSSEADDSPPIRYVQSAKERGLSLGLCYNQHVKEIHLVIIIHSESTSNSSKVKNRVCLFMTSRQEHFNLDSSKICYLCFSYVSLALIVFFHKFFCLFLFQILLTPLDKN